MECIICKGVGVEPLSDNTNCSCKYKRHNSCWIDYVHSTDKVKDPLGPPTPSAPLLEQSEVIIIPNEAQDSQDGGNMKTLEIIVKVALVLAIIALILIIVKLFLF